MNSDMSSSKVMLSYDIYSRTYELEYSYCVIILIYELVYGLCVMKVAHLTLCLNTHITYIIGIRAKLVEVHRAVRCAQVLYLSICRIGDPGEFG